MRRVLLILFVLMGLVTACGPRTNTAGVIPNLTIKIGNETIKSTEFRNIKAKQPEIIKDIFKELLNSNTVSDIKYIKKGQEVNLDFGSNPPDKVSVKDTILRSDGTYMYSDKLTVDVPLLNKEDNIYRFIAKIHKYSGLSSSGKKTEYRGFSISAVCGKDEYISAFVINSDSEYSNIKYKDN